MRNLKKVLALVLALVMSLSLVTIANASIDFTDADDVKYEEAVDVMSSIGVIEGFETGTFNPNGTLTREQAAKIITYMLLGSEAAEKLGPQNTGFTDVPSTRWSSPYIGYCVSLGIVNGNGDGTFSPAGQLTGFAFAKMLLVALGYGVNDEYVGAGWTLAVARDGMQIGLYDEVSVSNAVITRDEACQLAFDALNSSLVVWSELFNTYTAYSDLGSQKLLGTLGGNVFKLTATYKTDDFGYNTRAWRQDNKVVTDYYFYAEIIDTVTDPTVTAGSLQKDYTWQTTTRDENNKVVDYDIPAYLNGDEVDDDFLGTLKALGSDDKLLMSGYEMTLVDEDENGEIDKVIITYEYLAKVTKVNAETASKERSVNLTVYTEVGEVKVTEVETEDFAKDQYILLIPDFSLVDGNTLDKDDMEEVCAAPLEMKAAESFTGSVTAYYNDTVKPADQVDEVKNANGSVTVDGVKYTYNGIYAYDAALGNNLSNADPYKLGSKASYTFYLDSQGYVIGAEVVEDSISDFAYVIGVAKSGFDPIVKVLKSDGTIGTYVVSSKSTAKTYGEHDIYSYSINSAGEIVLSTLDNKTYFQAIEDGKVNTFTKGSSAVTISANGPIYANDETVFAYYDEADNTVKVFTGKNNAPSITSDKSASAVYKMDNKNKIAQFIVITDDPETTVTDNYVYVLKSSYVGTSTDKNDDTIYWYEVVMGTEEKVIAVDSELKADGVYKYSVDATLFDGDSANSVEPGVYTMELMDTNISGKIVADKVISNTIETKSGTYEISPDTEIIDVEDPDSVKFDETLEAGDTFIVVYEESNKLYIAKSIYITTNKK